MGVIEFSVYSVDSGEVLKTGYCHEAALKYQAGCGESLILDLLDRNTQYVANGVVVEKPPRPSQHHIFNYTTKQWVDARTPDTEWLLVRAERDRRLQASDWTQLPDVPLATKEAWASYRQALRDITEQTDPFNITWPEAPA